MQLQPNSLPVFARFAEYPPTFFRWSRCFGRTKRSCKLIWSACKSSSFYVPNPSACDGFYPLQLEGGCEERGLLSSQRFLLNAENGLYPPTLCRLPYLQGMEPGSHWRTRWGILRRGSGAVWSFERTVGYAVSTNKPPPPGANRLTFCRWREEGKRGNSSEGWAAGLYLRVKKWTRNCSEDIKRNPFETQIISVSRVQLLKFQRIFFFMLFFATTLSLLAFAWDWQLITTSISNCCIIALLLSVLCLQLSICALFLLAFSLDDWNLQQKETCACSKDNYRALPK